MKPHILLVALSTLTCLALSAAAQLPLESIHPTFPLLDEQGRNVLDSAGPVSPMATCGACHDTRFIEEHSSHADAGLSSLAPAGETPSGRPWDMSTGLFGQWNPLTYRYLSPPADSVIDLSTADWVRFYGRRHVGGGPAAYSRDGAPLADLDRTGGSGAETTAFDPSSGQRGPWQWRRSGVAELNCFLCHTSNPDNDGRIAALEDGEFRWASTATLSAGGLVTKAPSGWRWDRDAFDAHGHVLPERLAVQDPTNDNCGLCHGLIHGEPNVPVLLKGCVPEYWSTMTTGQIVSPQRIGDSGMNIKGKASLTRSWDVHAERLVDCVDCHYSRNNPVYWDAGDPGRPAHLRFEARRMSFGAYVRRPSHRLANAASNGGDTAFPHPQGCASCHDPQRAHRWLPFSRRHTQVLDCAACHVPRLHSPAREMIDWTVITPDRKARTVCRGATSPIEEAGVLIEGFEPVLLPTIQSDGEERLAPHNLVASWFWIAGDPPRPVRLDDLAAAFLDGEAYHADIVRILDRDGSGTVGLDELVLDSEEKVAAVRARLESLGLADPRILAEMLPYGIHHAVAAKGWAVKDCAACHAPRSRLEQPFTLGRSAPAGVPPALVPGTNVRTAGVVRFDSERVVYEPRTAAAGLYVLGLDSHPASDALGVFAMAAVLGGVAGHGALRIRAARKARGTHRATKPVYMYGAYERFWHWLQAITIIALIVTGLEIHFPGRLRLLGFSAAVSAHTIMAAIVLVNAFLAVFYHVASGQIRQYLPAPRGFFDQAIRQARYYLAGIFRHEPHPFAKVPERKLNPLQQVTYLALLNVLLPLQIATGILMWGTERWPMVDRTFGGLGTLAPIHAAGAWLFSAFVVAHIYLTTTGHTPLSSIRAMLTGWEDVDGEE